MKRKYEGYQDEEDDLLFYKDQMYIPSDIELR